MIRYKIFSWKIPVNLKIFYENKLLSIGFWEKYYMVDHLKFIRKHISGIAFLVDFVVLYQVYQFIAVSQYLAESRFYNSPIKSLFYHALQRSNWIDDLGGMKRGDKRIRFTVKEEIIISYNFRNTHVN